MASGNPELEPVFDIGSGQPERAYVAPQVGFAAALRAGAGPLATTKRLDQRPRQKLSLEKPPKTGGRTQKDRPRTDRHPATQVSPRFVAGRRVRMDDPANQWRTYLTELRDQNPLLAVVEPKNLIVRGVSDTEMAAMLDEKFQRGRVKTSSRARSQLRAYVKEIDAACQEVLGDDYAAQNGFASQNPDVAKELFEIANQPDEAVHLAHDNGVDVRTARSFMRSGLFVPATFNVAAGRESSPIRNGRPSDILEVPIQDSEGLLAAGQRQFLDVLEDFDLNTSRVEQRTAFSLEVTTLGQYSLEGLQLRLPSERPPQVPLAGWGLCEISN